MIDFSLLSQEAKTIHSIFESYFYGFATLFLLVGVLIEYFKIPIGALPAFTPLVGRVFISAILLISYPEISNTLAEVTDAICEKLGSLNQVESVLGKASEKLKTLSWSWTSIRGSILLIVSYFAYFVLQFTVLFFDAAILFASTLLYAFSPLLISFFILPQTSGITKAMFRSLFELSGWKIVWSVLGTLLWSSAIEFFDQPESQINSITLASYLLILSLSILLTPFIVNAMTSKGIAGVTGTLSGMSSALLTAGALSPTGFSKTISTPAKGAARQVQKVRSWRGGRIRKANRKNESSPSPQNEASSNTYVKRHHQAYRKSHSNRPPQTKGKK